MALPRHRDIPRQSFHKSAVKGLEVAEAEGMLKSAVDFCNDLVTTKAITEDQRTELIGLLRVRTGAWLCNWGKMSFEQRTFESMAEIQALFLESLAAHFERNGVETATVIFPQAFMKGVQALQHAWFSFIAVKRF